MARAAAMLERLPLLYREGELVEGLVTALALQQEVLDEEALEVQRSHWFDTCLDLDEAAALAAVLDIAPEPWQSLAEYRPWVHALVEARVREGSVTIAAVRGFVERYTDGYQTANRVALVTNRTPEIVENPPRLVTHREGPIEPLRRFTVTNRGLDPAPLAVELTGLGRTGPEYAPMLANRTTGAAIVYRGAVPPGASLLLRTTSDGIRAELDGDDVSSRLRLEGERPLELGRGDNELWFLPLAHYDTPGLDRVLLHLADDALTQGRWNGSTFDHALFYQDAAAVLEVAWVETVPASFVAELHAEVMQSRPTATATALAAREELLLALDTALAELSGAGVRSSVRARAHRDVQVARDRLRTVLPLRHREVGPTGADDLAEAGALFDVTEYDESTLR